ncbi:hypothetical protein NL676_000753 [Syzygium grande]|nr:hypothetical protein NL676_000753 [Syzygium grande]
MAPRLKQPNTGLFVGLNKGHIVTKKELAPRPSDRKGLFSLAASAILRLSSPMPDFFATKKSTYFLHVFTGLASRRGCVTQARLRERGSRGACQLVSVDRARDDLHLLGAPHGEDRVEEASEAGAQGDRRG